VGGRSIYSINCTRTTIQKPHAQHAAILQLSKCRIPYSSPPSATVDAIRPPTCIRLKERHRRRHRSLVAMVDHPARRPFHWRVVGGNLADGFVSDWNYSGDGRSFSPVQSIFRRPPLSRSRQRNIRRSVSRRAVQRNSCTHMQSTFVRRRTGWRSIQLYTAALRAVGNGRFPLTARSSCWLSTRVAV